MPVGRDIMKVSKIIFTDFKFDVRVNKEAEALIEHGYDCEVLAYTHSKPDKINYSYVKVFEMTKGNKIKLALFFLLKLIKYYKTNKPDVIHIHDMTALPIGFLISKLYSIPIIFDAHELYHVINNHRKIKKRVLKTLIPKLNGLITVNNSLLSIYEKEFGANNAVVINNSPDYNVNTPLYMNKDIFGIQAINDQDFLLLFQGYIVPERGIERLINIMKFMPETYKLIILGTGNDDYITSLEALTKEVEVESKVYFVDAVPYKELLNYTSSASMGIYLIENTNMNQYLCLPNKIFEFLAAELPVVSVDFPEIKRILESEHKIGVVISPDIKDRELAKEIISYSKSEAYANAKLNLKNNKKHFSWGNEKIKLIHYYETVVREFIR